MKGSIFLGEFPLIIPCIINVFCHLLQQCNYNYINLFETVPFDRSYQVCYLKHNFQSCPTSIHVDTHFLTFLLCSVSTITR